MSSVITVMARALQRELLARGSKAYPLADCEAIMNAVLQTSGQVAERAAAMTEQEFLDNLKRST